MLFFNDLKVPRVISKIILTFLIALEIPLGVIYLNINTNPFPRYTQSILNDGTLRDLIEERIIEESKKNTALADQRLVVENSGKLKIAISELMSDPESKKLVDEKTEQIYNFYVKGEKEKSKLDIGPIIDKVYPKLFQVDNQLQLLLPEKSEIQFIELPNTSESEKINGYMSILKVVFFVIIALIIIVLLTLTITSESFYTLLPTIGKTVTFSGIYMATITFIINQVANIYADTNSDILIKNITSTIISTLTKNYYIFSGVVTFLGTVVIIISLYLKKNRY